MLTGHPGSMPNSGSTSTSSHPPVPLKRRRITRACDRCHKGGIKCAPSDDSSTCMPCASFGSECTYDRPRKRRGPPRKDSISNSGEPPENGDRRDHKGASITSHGRESSGTSKIHSGYRDDEEEDQNACSSKVKLEHIPASKPRAPTRPVEFGEPGSASRKRARVSKVEDIDHWQAMEIASPEVIEELVEGYHLIVYPIQSFYHWPSFSADVRRRRYLRDRPFYCTVMAVCAMFTARLRDGARLPKKSSRPTSSSSYPYPQDHQNLGMDPRLRPPPPTSDHRSYPPSESFYQAALHALPVDTLQATDFEYRRAKTVMAMLCIQYGRIKESLCHLGDVITINASEGFYNEARWPHGLNAIEVEERRRLCWQVYQIDVYVTVTWGGMIRHREAQIHVQYPTEVTDESQITVHGYRPAAPSVHPRNSLSPSSASPPMAQFRGWNFVTDLYRILEHATDRLRMKRHGALCHESHEIVTSVYTSKSGPDPGAVLDHVSGLYEALPREFKYVSEMNGDFQRDSHGFIAANIIITMQTLRMVVTGTEEADVHQRSTIAAETLNALSTIPICYIQATSAPMIHHLAGVGHLLGSVIQSPLSQHDYVRVRTVLLNLADFLSVLEVALKSATMDIANKIRAHVSRIDNYMTEAALRAVSHGGTVIASMESEAKDRRGFGPGPTVSSNHSAYAANALPAPLAGYPPSPSSASLPPFNLGDWVPSRNVSPSQQFQLPDSLFLDWPFSLGSTDPAPSVPQNQDHSNQAGTTSSFEYGAYPYDNSAFGYQQPGYGDVAGGHGNGHGTGYEIGGHGSSSGTGTGSGYNFTGTGAADGVGLNGAFDFLGTASGAFSGGGVTYSTSQDTAPSNNHQPNKQFLYDWGH